MVAEIAKTHLFYLLPVTSPTLVGPCIQCVKLLFAQSPQSLTKYIVRVLSALLQSHPADMLIAFQPFVRAFPSLTDVWEIADLLLQAKSIVINTENGHLVEALVAQLMITSPEYVTQRGAYAIHFFHCMLESEVAANVIGGLHGLALFAALKPSYSESEFPVILRLLRSGTYAPHAVSLIARLQQFPVTDELISGLLVRGKEIAIALAALVRLATISTGRDLILKYRHEMYGIASVYPIWAFRLFLVVFDARTFSTDPEFPEFLAVLIRSRDKLVLAGMETIFAKLNVDPELVYELGDARFFSAYAECSGDAAGAFLAVYARAAEIAWCPDIDACQHVLLGWIGREDLRERLLQAFAAIAKYASVAYALRKSSIVGVLAGMRSHPTYGSLVSRVLQLVEK
jgi:hypothetical protein